LIDANDSFVEASGRPLEDLVGHHFFALFPKMPPDPGGDPMWTALERAVTSGRPERDRLIRYDVEDPARPGVFEERYWSAVVRPIRGLGGELDVLELSAREITSVIFQYRELERSRQRPA
jgi:PAS domain-containing protein